MAKREDSSHLFRCQVITPTQQVLDMQVSRVIVMAIDGLMEIKYGYEATLSPLSIDIMKVYDSEGRELKLVVNGGYVDADGENVTILADSAEKATDIDVERAKESYERAKSLLAQVSSSDAKSIQIDVDRAKAAMLRALNRLNAKNIDNLG